MTDLTDMVGLKVGGSKIGRISWKVDLSECPFNVESVHLKVQCEEFENGKVSWNLITDQKSQPIQLKKQQASAEGKTVYFKS